MIEVSYETKIVREGRQFKISIQGHAIYAEPGKDIVCAGVSALTYALVSRLEKIAPDSDMVVKEGDVRIKTLGRIYTDILMIESTYDTVVSGLEQLAHAYPNYVKVCRVGTLTCDKL